MLYSKIISDIVKDDKVNIQDLKCIMIYALILSEIIGFRKESYVNEDFKDFDELVVTECNINTLDLVYGNFYSKLTSEIGNFFKNFYSDFYSIIY